MTLCPGKQVGHSNTGNPWERDLSLDMSVIAGWGATTLVSLMEEHEFAEFGVPGLGKAAEEAGLEWHLLPIRDVDVPDERFERLWVYSGHVLRRKLKAGRTATAGRRVRAAASGVRWARRIIRSPIRRRAAA